MKKLLSILSICFIGSVSLEGQTVRKYLDAQLVGLLYGHVKEVREGSKNYSLFNEEGQVVIFEGSPVTDIFRDDKDRIISFKTTLFNYSVSWGYNHNYHTCEYRIRRLTFYPKSSSQKLTSYYLYDDKGMYRHCTDCDEKNYLDRKFDDRTFDSHGNLVHANEHRRIIEENKYYEYHVDITYYPEGNDFSLISLEERGKRLLDMIMCPFGFKPNMSDKKSSFFEQISDYLKNKDLRLRQTEDIHNNLYLYQILNAKDKDYFGQVFDIFICGGYATFKEEYRNKITYVYEFKGSIFEIRKLKKELITVLESLGIDLSSEKESNYKSREWLHFSRGKEYRRFADSKSKLVYRFVTVNIDIDEEVDKDYPDMASLRLISSCDAIKSK